MKEVNSLYDVLTAQERMVVKGNALIQKSRYSLSLMEQKIILYIISKIKPTDRAETAYNFNIDDFIKVCCLNSNGGKYTKYINDIMEELGSKVISIDLGENKTLLSHWFSSVIIDREQKTFTVSFDYNIKPYLYELQSFYTMYRLEYILPMTSKYSIRLYEFLRSIYSKGKKQKFSIEEVRERIDCDKYPNYKDFRKNVLEIAIGEINHNTDLYVSYEAEKTGHRVSHIIFSMRLETEEEMDMWGTSFYSRRKKEIEGN